MRILALESVRNQVVVVGEDLGTVEPEVRETLARFGILSYRLFYFEKNEQRRIPPLRRVPAAGAGLFNHPRSADAGRILDGSRSGGAPRGAGVLDDAGYRAQCRRAPGGETEDARRAVLACSCCPGTCRARPRDYPELTGELHNAIVGFLARTPSPAAGDQPGGPDQGNRPAEPAGHHLAVSELGPQDAVYRGSSCAPIRKRATTPRCSATGSSKRGGRTSQAKRPKRCSGRAR